MALSPSSTYTAHSKASNIQENWLVHLGFFNGDADGSGEGGWDSALQSDGSNNTVDADPIDSSETEIDVLEGDPFTSGDVIRIDDEIMLVTGSGSSTIDVRRGYHGTSGEVGNHADSRADILWNNYFPLAMSNTTVDEVFHHGAIQSSSISIRDSISLAESKASTSNITIQLINIEYQGDDLSAELLYGTRTYLNREVRVYSQLNSTSALSDCMQIYSGKLTEIQHTDDTITLTITAKRPWDRIEFPQTKHSKYNVYEPVVYGDFTASDKTDAAYGTVFPVPVLNVGKNQITTLMPKSYSNGSNSYLHYYVGQDYFLSMTVSTSDNTDTEATTTESGVNILDTPASYKAYGYIVPQVSTYNPNTVTFLSNPSNAFDRTSTGDWDTSTVASVGITASGAEVVYIQSQTADKVFTDSGSTIVDNVKLRMGVTITDGSGTNQIYDMDFFANGNTGSTNLLDADDKVLGTGSTGSNFTFALSTDADPPEELLIKWNPETAPPTYIREAHTLKCFGVKIRPVIRFDQSDDDLKRLSDIKYFYCGADGLTASWDSGAIVYGHDAHRDLLYRFTGETGTPDNWSALDTDRTVAGWSIRYWQHEPVSLQEKLEQLQYEFGFVAKYSPSGTIKYIHIAGTASNSAYQAADADHTLTKSDTANLQVSTTLNDIVTTMEISNKLHPAESSRYYSITTASNSASRTKYNIDAKENIQNVNLDMNVGTIPTSAASDYNADFYSYYDNIVGTVRTIISCDVVNPAKGFTMETGDIVTMSDMGVDPGGYSWTQSGSQYYMITELKRSVGKVSITLREVG